MNERRKYEYCNKSIYISDIIQFEYSDIKKTHCKSEDNWLYLYIFSWNCIVLYTPVFI